MSNSNPSANSAAPKMTWYGKTFNILLKVLMSFVGITILSLGATLLRSSKILGLDPFTAVNIGMSNHLHMSLGLYQLLANLVIFVFVLFLDRHMIGIGTIMNMVLVGFEIQIFTQFYQQIFPEGINFFVIVANAFLGLILFTAGSSIYMAPNLGVAPYDAIAPIVSSRLHIKYKTARVIQDILFLIAAVLAGGPVGFASIIVAFFAGPLIAYWNKHISDPIVNGIDDFSEQPTVKHAASTISKATLSGYHYLTHAYNATLNVQMNLSGYTNQQLGTRLHDAQTNMEDSQKAYNAYRTQYRMLMAEMMKRSKNGNVDPQSTGQPKNSSDQSSKDQNNQNNDPKK